VTTTTAGIIDRVTPETFRSFWFGRALSPLERLSITSFVEHGHRYELYVYDEVEGIPDGCDVLDAATVVERSEVFVHQSPRHFGTVSGFANVFRYVLLRDLGGWWVDADVVCTSKVVDETDYVFAEVDGQFQNAIIRAPAKSELMRVMVERAQRNAGAEQEFATTGPPLFTTVVRELGLGACAWSESRLYPVSWTDALHLLEPERADEIERATAGSVMLHLWNEVLRVHGILKAVRPPYDSFLDRMYRRYDIEFPPEPRYEWRDLVPQISLQKTRADLKQELLATRSGQRPLALSAAARGVTHSALGAVKRHFRGRRNRSGERQTSNRPGE
jgi:Alpha 1,4-glycosyltransferase conserved region